MAKRKVRQISRLAPIQRDTAHLIPNSYILGGLSEKIDVTGTAFADLIKATRVSDANPVLDGVYRFVCTDTGKFKVTNLVTGVELAEQDATSQAVTISNFVVGLTVTVESGLSGVIAGDTCDVYVNGDTTYIIPGTILGRVKAGEYQGKYEPIGSDLEKYDILRVCGGTIETNKQNLIAPNSDTFIVDDKYTVDVYVFAQVIESACRAINLTDNAKAKIQGIVWE